MLATDALAANPFAALLDPAAVLERCARSPRLKALASQVHRPLDKPILPKDPTVAEYDAEIDGHSPASRRTDPLVRPDEEPLDDATGWAAL